MQDFFSLVCMYDISIFFCTTGCTSDFLTLDLLPMMHGQTPLGMSECCIYTYGQLSVAVVVNAGTIQNNTMCVRHTYVEK